MTELDFVTVFLSVKTATVATLVTFLIGLPTAWFMANHSFRGKVVLDALFLAPLVLPPTVVGFVLLLVLGSQSPLGQWAQLWTGENLLFSWLASVIAASVVAFPLMYRTALGAFSQIDDDAIAAGRTLGAHGWRIFWELAVPMAWPGIVAAVVLTFARALGEFGATIMVGGNIPGRTRTIPLAIFSDVESGDLRHAALWVGAMIAVSLALVIFAGEFGAFLVAGARRLRPRSTGTVAEIPAIDVSPHAVPITGAVQFRLWRRISESFTLDVAFASAGKSCAIVGASGAGKSALLRCLSGLEHPDAGEILINGRKVFDGSQKINVAPAERRIGHVFQNYALFPHLSVFANVAFALRDLPQRERGRRVETLLQQVGLQNAREMFPGQLSGGQQQRLAILRAIAAQPDLLLLDEPFSALDTHLRHQLEEALLQVMRGLSGITLLVTHNLEEAFRMCDDLVVLDEGRIIAAGEKHAVFAQPGSRRAAVLTGCKNISRIQPGAGTILALDWGHIPLHLAAPLPPHATHVGIRAHQIRVQPTLTVPEKNAVPCWLVATNESPHRMTVYLRFTADAAVRSHVQVEMPKDFWLELKASPQPWTAILAAERLMPLT